MNLINVNSQEKRYEFLDDDNKLRRKYNNKKYNCKKEGLVCLLTFDDYCQLMIEAGIKSSDLGFTGNNYVLARYNDEGNYEIGNCRFITQKENSNEKKQPCIKNTIVLIVE